MYAACAFEVVLGLRVALGRARGWVTVLQLGMMAGFTAILGVVEPMLLVNPFGMLTKNMPLAALITAVWMLERQGWSRRVEWVLRSGVGAIWITEGLFPKILFQQQIEIDVVAGSGLVPGDPAVFLVVLGVGQIISGVAVLLLRGRPLCWLLAAQVVALVVLPVLVSWQEPFLWVHPFGPLTKNVPILAATGLLLVRLGDPWLTARWSHLCLFNFAVPREVLEKRLPADVELDFRDGQAFVSFVSLDFGGVRVLGIPWPFFGSFPDVNLRFYARRREERGVVFIREFVPRPFLAWAARTMYNEPFESAVIRSRVEEGDSTVRIERELEIDGRAHTVKVEAKTLAIGDGETSEADFFKERYWGFGTDRRGRTIRFRVDHPPWKILTVQSWDLDVDWKAVYGPGWAFLESTEPHSVVVAVGSRVGVAWADRPLD